MVGMMEIRSGRRNPALVALATLGLAAVSVGFWQIRVWTDARARPIRQALLDELQPVALRNCTLGRFGGPNDTTFLMCKNLLEGLEIAYSYGVGGNDDWGCDISARYAVPVRRYDCFNPPRPTCEKANFDFHAECLGDRRKQVASRWFDSLANQISDNGDSGKRLIMKIDVEGAEWESLMATPDESLQRIDQLAIEFRGVNEGRFVDVVRKLKRTFHIANLYFNNQACSADAAPLPGRAYQVLFVNKRLGVIDPEAVNPPLPSPLNEPNNPELPDCQPEVPDRAARERQIRQALLDELRPVVLQNCTLARFGSVNDGGYLVCQNLIKDLESAYSYGVGPNDQFGCEVSTRYSVPVHQYDCFDPARPVCSTGRFVFHNECIGDRREVLDSRMFDTLTNQIARNGDSSKGLLVKIDVEGAEWDSLMATPDEILNRIDQMPMELHGINEPRFLKTLQKLKRTFYLVSLHFNNNACTAQAAPLPGWAYQVLLVNKRIGVLDPTKGTPPLSPLHAPDNLRKPDCQLAQTNR
jgi:hypothetical protein